MSGSGKQWESGKSLPVSAFPPLALARPLELFGQMPVHVSTPLTLSPVTLFEVMFGTTLHAVLREKSGRQGAAFYQHLKDLWSIHRGKRRLTVRLRNLTFALLGRFVPRDRLERDLDGHQDEGLTSDWRAAAGGMAAGAAGEDDWLFRGVLVLAEIDETALEYRETARRGETEAVVAALRATYGDRIWHWLEFDPRFNKALMLPLETVLEALAMADALAVSQSQRDGSFVLELLQSDTERPMTRWLQLVQAATPGQPTLEVLSSRSGVSQSTLKHWSSSRERLMPEDRLDDVLGVVLLQERREQLRALFFAARLLTFVCDVTRAGTLEEPRPWSEVQAHVRAQYERLWSAATIK